MIYAVDFDGILYKDGTLDPAVCDRINELTSSGDSVVVFTSRQGKALAKAKELLESVSVTDVVGGKFFADYYVDDKSMTLSDFLGDEKRMTPNDRIKFKDQSQARALSLALPTQITEKRFDTEHYVEGLAARFEPYLLFDDGDFGKTFERFEPDCFKDCDMSDIILQYDHAGRVFARNTNGTLIVEPTAEGLFMAADLSKTSGSRALWEDIDAGLITKMSWRFRVGEYHIERKDGSKDITIVHTKVKKIYDVSAVSIPANDSTSINSRSFVDGVIAEEARREAEINNIRNRLKLKIKTTI